MNRINRLIKTYDFGYFLKCLRMSENLTTQDVADKLGISRQAVFQIENKKTFPKVDVLRKIGMIFGLSLPEMIFLTENTRANPAWCVDGVFTENLLPYLKTFLKDTKGKDND